MAKAIKETTEETTEQVVKKSRSGKRKPKEAKDVVITAEFVEHGAAQIVKEVDALIAEEISGDKKTFDPKADLTPQAYQWMLYLQRNQMTPEQWLSRYPTNKFKHHIEEIVRVKSQK